MSSLTHQSSWRIGLVNNIRLGQVSNFSPSTSHNRWGYLRIYPACPRPSIATQPKKALAHCCCPAKML
jgi:hypothetical protein